LPRIYQIPFVLRFIYFNNGLVILVNGKNPRRYPYTNTIYTGLNDEKPFQKFIPTTSITQTPIGILKSTPFKSYRLVNPKHRAILW